jgi:hypothetical protein
MNKTARQLVATLVYGVALFSPARLTHAQSLTAGAASCRFAVPSALGKGTAFWMGDCTSGHAEGHGVIRLQPKSGGAPHLFYGLLKAGIPQTGILQLAEDQWQPIWHFDANMAAVENTSGDMQVAINALRAAAKGAHETSKRYRTAGNAASAGYYDRLAKRFETQMNE